MSLLREQHFERGLLFVVRRVSGRHRCPAKTSRSARRIWSGTSHGHLSPARSWRCWWWRRPAASTGVLYMLAVLLVSSLWGVKPKSNSATPMGQRRTRSGVSPGRCPRTPTRGLALLGRMPDRLRRPPGAAWTTRKCTTQRPTPARFSRNAVVPGSRGPRSHVARGRRLEVTRETPPLRCEAGAGA